jgi:heme exporter protein B
VGVGLTVSVRRGGALLALLVLPLYVPVLIFGANAVAAAADGLPTTGQIYMLGAFLALAASLAPVAAASALRVTAN